MSRLGELTNLIGMFLYANLALIAISGCSAGKALGKGKGTLSATYGLFPTTPTGNPYANAIICPARLACIHPLGGNEHSNRIGRQS